MRSSIPKVHNEKHWAWHFLSKVRLETDVWNVFRSVVDVTTVVVGITPSQRRSFPPRHPHGLFQSERRPCRNNCSGFCGADGPTACFARSVYHAAHTLTSFGGCSVPGVRHFAVARATAVDTAMNGVDQSVSCPLR